MSSSSSDLHPRLVVSPSKSLRLLFTKIRDATTSSEDFVRYSKRVMRLVAEDALAEFPSTPVTIQTPTQTSFEGSAALPGRSVCAVSVVRSGDCLVEAVREVEPSCKVGKILIQRDENDPEKRPKLYYSKLPPNVGQLSAVLLCDPMLATGGSALTALKVLCDEPNNVDPSKIVFCNVICCPEGLKALAEAYPDVKIVTACVDEGLNENKYIVPGLGDYGDRFFNTVSE